MHSSDHGNSARAEAAQPGFLPGFSLDPPTLPDIFDQSLPLRQSRRRPDASLFGQQPAFATRATSVHRHVPEHDGPSPQAVVLWHDLPMAPTAPLPEVPQHAGHVPAAATSAHHPSRSREGLVVYAGMIATVLVCITAALR